jgi:transcriptional regulator with XRE-family HTH domain
MASMAKQRAPRRTQPRIVRHYVRQWRDFRGLTQEQLAERVGKSRALITQIEKGWTDLTEEMIYSLSEALNCEPGDLFRVNPQKAGAVVDITDMLKNSDPAIQAEALGYIRGLVAGSKH